VKLKPADNNGYLAAAVVIVSQGRALMLLDRNRIENGGEILLGCTGGRRAYIDESAWDCARRMVSAETGGLAELPPEIPSAVGLAQRQGYDTRSRTRIFNKPTLVASQASGVRV
jgi:hypothetical protein